VAEARFWGWHRISWWSTNSHLNTFKYEYNMNMIHLEYTTDTYDPHMTDYDMIMIHYGYKIYLIIIRQP
jgi:hypothetical protein